MDTGYLLLALIAIPLFTALAIVFIPSDKKDLIRQLAVLSGLVMFIISVYAFPGGIVGHLRKRRPG